MTVLAVGPSGAGKSLKTNLLASEILGSANPYAVGGTHRHIPEIRQALAAARMSENGTGIGSGVRRSESGERIRFRRRRGHPDLLHPRPRADVARHPRDAHRADRPRRDRCRDPRRLGGRLRRRDLRAAAARRASSRAPPTCWARTPPSSAWRSIAPRIGSSWSPPSTTWSRARPVRPIQSMNIALGLPEGTRAHRERSRPVSVTAAPGFRGGRRRRRAQVERQARRRRRRQPRPAQGRRGRLHAQPREGQPDHLVAAGRPGRRRRGDRAQLRRSELLHRLLRLPDDAPDRREGRRAARRRARATC